MGFKKPKKDSERTAHLLVTGSGYMKICVMGLRGFPLVEGGVEKHCEYLYPLMRDDMDITVFRRKSYIITDASYKHIKFIDLPSTRIKGLETIIYSFLATRRIIRMKPDVVHIHNIGPALFSGIITKKGIPVVLTYHSPNYEHSKWGGFAKKLLIHSEKIALKNAKQIIFVNQFQMEKYPEEVKKKSVYIPNGICEPVLTHNREYLNEIGVKSGEYILAVGRITPEKGFDTLIKGFRRSKHGGYKLVIAGGVEFESRYMEELKRLGGKDIIFTGYVYGDKLVQLYSNAALYVLASNNEGFPLVLLEAMSYGLDVLVSDIPATHLIKLNEDDYFRCGDDKTLSKKISERVKGYRKRSYELHDYNWNVIAEKTMNVFDLTYGNERDVCR